MEQKPVEDLVEYFSKHDDSDFPYYGKRGKFEYKNEAYRKLEALIQIYKGATFVFHGLVKCTIALINGRIYYITFTAKAEEDPEVREYATKIYYVPTW